ncbi:TPA: hypothetical protein I7753_18580 [Vibrio vulnificus]|uniref:Uncharacterized protein n=1 Tax=Vibrio vulnificus TaxID=672 RepID=A0ABX4X0M1_VIBVL|nr:hypothetical protein [Vibrio vulnificus]EJS4045558.1 hypothetical protein [Vibrio vulnificus]KHF82514.1 hypothetical protein OA15_19680 [Vibrio vulnificus]PNM76951.1 hypothetical protein AL548_007490 [Vibrio vulnificus]HAS8483498.1 hypothetical protein [Vibrio vulnificus]
MEDEKLFAESLTQLVDEVESTITQAASLGYIGVSADISLDVAKELIKAVKYYQEPKFYGWPISLVELYLDEEEQIPEQVFRAYKEHVDSLGECNDTNQPFFIDEAYSAD